MKTEQPAIQLIANLVVEDRDRVLLARYNPEAEADDPDAEQRWWLPAHELEPYQHPDDGARIALEEIPGVDVSAMELSRVQSFRGRRGWHISFDYRVAATGAPTVGSVEAACHPVDELPPMMHGNWERDTIDAVRAGGRTTPGAQP